MKKLILCSILLAFAITTWGQTDTLTASDYSTKWYSNDSRSFLFHVQDTVTDEDTLFFPADTIVVGDDSTFIAADTVTTGPDSVVLILPSVLGNSFAGMMTVVSDSIEIALQGDVGVQLYQSACETCEYFTITGTDVSHTSPPDSSNKFFQVRGLKLKLVYWAINGSTDVDIAIVLKPSAIANNASN